MASPDPHRFYPVLGQELMLAIRRDMERTITPDWMKLPPKSLGSVHHGKVSSKEWRTVYAISFPSTLIRKWGSDYYGSPMSKKHEVLDNFLHLTLATLLCTQYRMTALVVKAYDFHMRAYLSGFRRLYPDEPLVNYHHAALHLPTFLTGYGPGIPWGTGPYEVMNGMCQDIKTNSVFGRSP